jgi:hypothetical protein
MAPPCENAFADEAGFTQTLTGEIRGPKASERRT